MGISFTISISDCHAKDDTISHVSHIQTAAAPEFVSPHIWTAPNILIVNFSPSDYGTLASANLPPNGALHFAKPAELCRKLIAHLAPEIVVVPLINHDDNSDAVDVAKVLTALEFDGVLRVLSTCLPRPQIVERELQAYAKGMIVDLAPVSRALI
ncbi:hypothetical protein [Litoreibacter roseus]|uniref:Response regulatory domain-containing protein n=1 Tax=Litoreibacter roseus TaxID=2601869 RepID=A0A6N6JN55_9RHOB|nr:hypothetical protein [Litoreibacter roseus]GFE66939.1 hypothetical protein KIN_40130 [Litoreibacter roseus]